LDPRNSLLCGAKKSNQVFVLRVPGATLNSGGKRFNKQGRKIGMANWGPKLRQRTGKHR